MTGRAPRLEPAPAPRRTRPDQAHGAASETLALTALLRGLAVVLLAVCLLLAGLVSPEAALAPLAASFIGANAALFLADIVDPRRGGVALLVSFFFLFFIAVPAHLQIRTGSFPFNSAYTDAQLTPAYLVLSVAQLAYLGGLWWRQQRPARSLRRGSDDQRLVRCVVVLAVLCAGLAALIGPDSLFLTRTERGDAVGAGEFGIKIQALFVGRSLSLVALVTIVYLLVRQPRLRRLSGVALLVAVAAVFLVLNYPPGLPRFQLLGATLAVAAVSVSLFTTRAKLVFAVLAPTFLFFLFPAIKSLGNGESVEVRASFQNNVSAYLLRVDFDGFKQIADTGIYLQGNPHRFGENFLGVLLFWVPRGIWAGKPVDSGLIVSDRLGYRYTNVSNPLPAESLISFGIIGVIAVFFLFGLVVAGVERAAKAGQEDAAVLGQVLVYGLCVGFVVIVLRGALNGVTPQFASGFVAYWVMSRYARTRDER